MCVIYMERKNNRLPSACASQSSSLSSLPRASQSTRHLSSGLWAMRASDQSGRTDGTRPGLRTHSLTHEAKTHDAYLPCSIKYGMGKCLGK